MNKTHQGRHIYTNIDPHRNRPRSASPPRNQTFGQLGTRRNSMRGRSASTLRSEPLRLRLLAARSTSPEIAPKALFRFSILHRRTRRPEEGRRAGNLIADGGADMDADTGQRSLTMLKNIYLTAPQLSFEVRKHPQIICGGNS